MCVCLNIIVGIILQLYKNQLFFKSWGAFASTAPLKYAAALFIEYVTVLINACVKLEFYDKSLHNI